MEPPADAESLTRAAVGLFDRGELEAARDALFAALDLAPDFTPALLLLRACVLWRGEPFHRGRRGCSTAALLQRARQAGVRARDAAFLRAEDALADAARGPERASPLFAPSHEFVAGAWLDLVVLDPGRALALYRDAAERGHAVALNSLGFCLRNGAGCAVDEPAALRAYSMAADRGVVVSQYNLGVCHDQGLGVPRDVEEAVRWYRAAADAGHAAAQLNLGVCYERGEGVSAPDERRAAALYAEAAEQDHAIAVTNLGICYYYGKGVYAADQVRAEALWERAVALGSAEAAYILGQLRCLACRGDSGPPDVRTAVGLFRLAAAMDHTGAKRAVKRFIAR